MSRVSCCFLTHSVKVLKAVTFKLLLRNWHAKPVKDNQHLDFRGPQSI